MENNDRRRERLILFETMNTVCWILLDIAWLMQMRTSAMAMAVPTVLTCIPIFFYSEKTAPNLLVNGAIASWACMNATWIMHDFKVLSWGFAAAKCFAAAEILLLVAAFLGSRPRKDLLFAVMARLRRVRIGRRD
jgi:hypothetical protein